MLCMVYFSPICMVIFCIHALYNSDNAIQLNRLGEINDSV